MNQRNAPGGTLPRMPSPRPTLPSLLKRLGLAFVLTTALLAAYVGLHIPLSYIDSAGGVSTSIPPLLDVLAIWLIAAVAALIVGPVRVSRWRRVVLLLVSVAFLGTVIASISPLLSGDRGWEWWPAWLGTDGYIYTNSMNWREVCRTVRYLAPVLYRLIGYWIVAPQISVQFARPGWTPAISLHLIFSALVSLVGGALAVVVAGLRDAAGSPGIIALGRTIAGTAERIAKGIRTRSIPVDGHSPDRSHVSHPPRPRSRWRALGVRIALLALLVVHITVCVAAYVANARIPALNWDVQVMDMPYHPKVRAFLARDDGTLFAGTSAGVFRSTDGGQSWALVSAGLDDTDVQTLALAQDGVLLAGTASGVFRFVDGATNWKRSSAGLPSVSVSVLLTQKDALLAATGGGVYVSLDDGKNWEVTSTAISGTSVRALAGESNSLFAGIEKQGIFRSADGGRTWELADVSSDARSVRALLVKDRAIYAATDTGVLRSTDGGQTWALADKGLAHVPVNALAADPWRGILFAGTDRGLFRSADGQKWEPASTGLDNTSVLALAIRENALLVGTAGGVFRSTDGQRWTLSSEGLTSTSVWALAANEQDGTLYAGTNQGGVFRSANGGQSWEAASAGLADTSVWALTIDPRQRTLFAGTREDGLYYSDDQGRTWAVATHQLTGSSIHVLVLDPRDRALYVATNTGVFRVALDQAGDYWPVRSIDLSGEAVWSLALDTDGKTLYAGTAGSGVRRSTDKGEHWEKVGEELDTASIRALVSGSDGTLYAGTGEGVWRSTDRGENWEQANMGLTNQSVWALALDPRDGTLFASTIGGGVFRSTNGGQRWESASKGLALTSARALLVDPRDGALFLGTDGGGVFRSSNAGGQWEPAGAGIRDIMVRVLASSLSREYLFAATSRGVFRSGDGGKNWQMASAGLEDTSVQALAIKDDVLFAGTDSGQIFQSSDGGQGWEAIGTEAGTGVPGVVTGTVTALASVSPGTLYAATSEGVFRSDDEGNTWSAASSGLPATRIRALWHGADGTVYAETEGEIYRLSDTDRWRKTGMPKGRQPLIGQGTTRTMTYHAQEGTVEAWALSTGSPVPIASAASLQSASIQPGLDGGVEIIATWGATLGRASLAPGAFSGEWLPWSLARSWVYTYTVLLVALGPGLAIISALAIDAIVYATWARPFGISLAEFLSDVPWGGGKALVDYARPNLDRAWPDWQRNIRDLVLWTGEVTFTDLGSIPRPYRRWALEQYATENRAAQPLDLQHGRLRLLAGDQYRSWLKAWAICADELRQAPRLTDEARAAIESMAQALRETAGFQFGRRHEGPAVQAYPVEAPAWRLNVPRRFPLIFLSDPHPGDETVTALFDAVSPLRDAGSSFFALIVPLEPPEPAVDVSAELRRLLRASPRANDFVVLTRDAILALLSARDPIGVLVQEIRHQVDLKTISPFQDSGVCPPNMFFGREREIKQIVEGVERGDFAIVGNRKAGKTSLLKRVRDELSKDNRFHPLSIDCQNVGNEPGFYGEFANEIGSALSADTPQGFEQALRQWHASSATGTLPVLLIDEVDELLNSEPESRERLSGTWRKLAQDGVCHFVFVGTDALARRLRDPESVFFNFAERLSLKYLPPETAGLVIEEPMDALGVTLKPHDEVVRYIVDLSSGHPNLLQGLGKRLVEHISDRQERIITLEACESVAANREFTDLYLYTIWGKVQPLEKLVTLVMAQDGFEAGDIENELRRRQVPFEPEELSDALDVLAVYAILSHEGRQFTFNPRHFREILERTQDVERLIDGEKRKLARQQRS